MHETYREIRRELTLNVVQNRVHSIRRKNITRTALRLVKDGFIGIGSAMGEYRPETLESRAEAMLKLKLEYPYPLSADFVRHEDHTAGGSTELEFKNEAEAILDELRRDYPHMNFSHQIMMNDESIFLSNEAGLDLSWRDHAEGMGLIFKEAGSSNIMDGFVTYSGKRLLREPAMASFRRYLDAYGNRVALPEKATLPVVFLSGDGLMLRKLTQELDGLMLGTGSSLLNGKTNERVFAEHFTLHQTRNENDLSTPFFDMEGSSAPDDRVALIERGVFLKGYTDKKTAALYNLPYTGSADGGYDYAPTLGAPALAITPSEHSLSELLGGDPGVLVYISSGGDYTPDGKLGAPVQLAFLLEGDRVVGRLPELNISSDLYTMFGSAFRGVSREPVYPGAYSRWAVIDMAVTLI
jgi:PmbA protein